MLAVFGKQATVKAALDKFGNAYNSI